MKKTALTLLGFAIVLYGAFLGSTFMNQRNMIYLPSLREKPELKALNLPAVQEITVVTEDHLPLYGWYKPAASPRMPTIVRFHGNGGNIDWNLRALLPYASKGYGILSAEYRGYSGNPGRPTEEGLYHDGHAFMDWLKEQGVPENNIIVYGESLGCGVAVQMAGDYPKIHTLILQSPFTSMVDTARFHYPYLPVQWFLRDRYDNFEKIKFLRAPLVVVHGTKDDVVPYNLGKTLFDEAPQPKTLITIEGGNHNNLYKFNIDKKILSALSE